LQLFDVDDFEISGPQFPTHYSPAEYGDVLDIVVHQNDTLSHVHVSDILDPLVHHMLDQNCRSHLKDSQIGNSSTNLPLTY
jgi:hypothetical protein